MITGGDVDWGAIPGRVEEKIHETSTAVKVIDFLVSHWWVILLCVAIVVFWPRRRRS